MQSYVTGPAPLAPEVAAVLEVLADAPVGHGLRLNALAKATGLPTGHVGRHLRTLEAERLAAFDFGRWSLTLRGARTAADLAAEGAPPMAA